MFISGFDAAVKNVCFLEARDVNLVPDHLQNDLFPFGRFLHTPNIETAYSDFSFVRYFHRRNSFNWFVRDVSVFGEFSDVGVGIYVMICLVFCVFCLALKSPVESSAVQLSSSVLGHCTPLWFRSGTSDFSPLASPVSVGCFPIIFSPIAGFGVSDSPFVVSKSVFLRLNFCVLPLLALGTQCPQVL